jgi:hypothetical protein
MDINKVKDFIFEVVLIWFMDMAVYCPIPH